MRDFQTKNNMVLVSIIITSYNRGEYIEQAVCSALAQDYPNLEIIISDNCSTDNTDEILKKYLKDDRIKFFKNDTNIGMMENFKLATQRARGNFITYISSDDYLMNNSFVSQAVSIINKYENILLVVAKNMTLQQESRTLIDDDTHQLYIDEFKDGREVFMEFANTRTLGWGSALMNKQEFDELNVFSSLETSLDYKANLLLMLKGNVGFIKQPSYVFRVHKSQTSTPPDANRIIENCEYIFPPYNYAQQLGFFPERKLEVWKNKLLALEARYATYRFSQENKKEYKKLVNFFRSTHPKAYKILQRDLKWRLTMFFLRNPGPVLRLLKIVNKKSYRSLKNLTFNSGNSA